MEKKFTKGEFYTERNIVGLKGQVGIIALCHLQGDKQAGGEMDETTLANAELIAQAFNVANQTGLTPTELLEENKRLREALKITLDDWTRLAGQEIRKEVGWSGFEKEIKESKVYQEAQAALSTNQKVKE